MIFLHVAVILSSHFNWKLMLTRTMSMSDGTLFAERIKKNIESSKLAMELSANMFELFISINIKSNEVNRKVIILDYNFNSQFPTFYIY